MEEVDYMYDEQRQFSQGSETPEHYVNELGWKWDNNNKKFSHDDSELEYVGGYLYWNNEKWIVPVYNECELNKTIIPKTFIFNMDNSSMTYSCKPYSFKYFLESRRGKRWQKYQQYLKRRKQKKRLYQKKENQKLN
jgi:hypothetical protein